MASSHSAADDDGSGSDECYLKPVPSGMEGVPYPFVDTAHDSSKSLGFIECFADSIATCLGNEYTIGVPCDYAVALCRYSDDDDVEGDDDDDDESEEGDGPQLVPLELDDPELDDVFPVAEAIVADGTWALRALVSKRRSARARRRMRGADCESPMRLDLRAHDPCSYHFASDSW
jgi:hypothetical protein